MDVTGIASAATTFSEANVQQAASTAVLKKRLISVPRMPWP